MSSRRRDSVICAVVLILAFNFDRTAYTAAAASLPPTATNHVTLLTY